MAGDPAAAEPSERPSPEPPSEVSDEILDRLSLIGEDITASLDFDDIFSAVERHVGVLLDAATFYIGLLDEPAEWIDIPLFVDGNRRTSARRLRVDDPDRPASRALRENREILREKTLEEARRTDIPGTAPTLSALFRPLVVRGRMIGVMSVQSARAGVYGRRERLIFRTLCAYVAVALANGMNFNRLAATEAEKLASLARLVAGVAHEVNTPVGTALTVTTTFARSVREFREGLAAGRLRRPDLDVFAAMSEEAARLVTANLVRTTDLMSEFGQVALDRADERPRAFRLADLVRSVLTTLGLELHQRLRRLDVAVPADLELVGLPEALGRVLTNLVRNVLAFAFRDGERGRLRIEAEPRGPGEVGIRVSDDGIGIPDAELAVIFEPFSATSRGSRGLGLHVAYCLAVGPLAGGLHCRSTLGRGTTFELTLPRVL